MIRLFLYGELGDGLSGERTVQYNTVQWLNVWNVKPEYLSLSLDSETYYMVDFGQVI